MMTRRTISWALACWALILFWPLSDTARAEEKKDEKTYSIFLTKTAGIEKEKEVRRVGNKKVLTETLTIQRGDWVWKILRQKGLLKKGNLSELLSVLKKLNTAFANLDLIHPGEKIIIPLKIAPIDAKGGDWGTPPKEVVPITALKDIKLESYTVRPGDALIRVARGKYDIPRRDLYHKYLELTKQLNPSIKDLNTIYPGQVIRLPIYSPEIVRRPIVTAAARKSRAKRSAARKRAPTASSDLGRIFIRLGETWVEKGKYSIPLQPAGKLDLDATSFPYIKIRGGPTVIVDMKRKLSPATVRLLASHPGNYQAVQLENAGDLRASLGKVLKACNYPKLYQKGEPFDILGDIAVRLTGDWVIKLPKRPGETASRAVVINLTDTRRGGIPRMITSYLEKRGIKVIDFPLKPAPASPQTEPAQVLPGGRNARALIATVLNLTGQNFTTQVEIPVYQGQKAGTKTLIKTDFLLNVNGKDTIIDLTGLKQREITFLKEHQFQFLSLVAEKKSLAMVAKTLAALGTQCSSNPFSITAMRGDDSRNVRLTFPGVAFSDSQGKAILATPLSLPDDIKAFLGAKGYRVLALFPS